MGRWKPIISGAPEEIQPANQTSHSDSDTTNNRNGGSSPTSSATPHCPDFQSFPRTILT